MKYPTTEEVEAATHLQLARWRRFLPSPGMSAVESSTDDFQQVMDAEREIGERIYERFQAFGGMTPEISKSIGWDD